MVAKSRAQAWTTSDGVAPADLVFSSAICRLRRQRISLESPDHQEAMTAYREGRDPSFSAPSKRR